MALCSMLCGSLDGRGVWGKMDTCICMAESLFCPPETITTWLISYTPIQNKKNFFNCLNNKNGHKRLEVSGDKVGTLDL